MVLTRRVSVFLAIETNHFQKGAFICMHARIAGADFVLISRARH